MNQKIVLYGAGEWGKRIIDILQFCDIEVAAILDSNADKWGIYLNKYIVESPDILCCMEDYILCITIENDLIKTSIRNALIEKYNINEINEISYMDLILYAYDQVDFKHLDLQDIKSYKQRKSVLFDCEYGLVLGGIEEWTKGICGKFIEENEYDAFIITNNGKYEIPENLINNIIRIDVTCENSYSPSNVIKLAKVIASRMPCTLVTSQPNEVLLVGKLLKKFYGSNVQVIAGIRGGHDDIYENYIQKKDCADLFVCVSSDITSNMIKRGIAADTIHTMICPMEYPNPLIRNYTVSKEKPLRLGYAGRIVKEQKRMDLMLNLIEEIEKRHLNYYLEFAGEGEYKEELRKYIKKEKIGHRVKLVGRLGKKELYEFWRDKDICLNIADYEGRSRTVVEAMANGVVPIVTETSGVHDDIRNGENGFIVPIGNYTKMADCIERLEANRELLSKMGKKAHLEIKDKSSMDDHYKFWKSIISE